MAGNLQKLVKKPLPSALRIIASFKTPHPSSLIHQPHLLETKPNDPITQYPLWGSSNTEQINSSQPQFQFYPSYPFGYFLNPISLNGVNENAENGLDKVGNDEQTTIWADSVKKKRKRKMNKHKLRKLRKNLRRKTKK